MPAEAGRRHRQAAAETPRHGYPNVTLRPAPPPAARAVHTALALDTSRASRWDQCLALPVVRPPVFDDGVLEPGFLREVGVVAHDDLQCAFVEVGHVPEEFEVGGDGVPVGVLDGGGVFDLRGEEGLSRLVEHEEAGDRPVVEPEVGVQGRLRRRRRVRRLRRTDPGQRAFRRCPGAACLLRVTSRFLPCRPPAPRRRSRRGTPCCSHRRHPSGPVSAPHRAPG